MKIKVVRFAKKDNYTIGHLTVDGETFKCDTGEPTSDTSKTPHCIPTGTYTLKLTMSPKFKYIVPLLLNVPGFGGVEFHVGNYLFDNESTGQKSDTHGCILVGHNKVVGQVINSKDTFGELMILFAKHKGEKHSVVICD